MNQQDMIDTLNDLIQLDVDAVEAYEQAIKNIDIANIRDNLQRFKGDHERHIIDLSTAVRTLGGTPAKRSQDIKGFVLEGFTAIRSATGNEGALKAMRSNEKLTNKAYDDALQKGLSPEVRQLVERNRDDERRHLEYIERMLRDRPWEQPQVTA